MVLVTSEFLTQSAGLVNLLCTVSSLLAARIIQHNSTCEIHCSVLPVQCANRLITSVKETERIVSQSPLSLSDSPTLSCCNHSQASAVVTTVDMASVSRTHRIRFPSPRSLYRRQSYHHQSTTSKSSVAMVTLSPPDLDWQRHFDCQWIAITGRQRLGLGQEFVFTAFLTPLYTLPFPFSPFLPLSILHPSLLSSHSEEPGRSLDRKNFFTHFGLSKTPKKHLNATLFYARKQNASRVFAIVWASVRLSVRPSVTRELYQNGAS